MRTKLLFDPAQAERAMKALSRGALPIKGSYVLGIQSPRGTVPLPTAWVDTAERPDVADLARVHALEAEAGESRATWIFPMKVDGSGLAVLTVRLLRPVRGYFKLVWDLDRDRAFLHLLAKVGTLAVTTVDPEAMPSEALIRSVTYTIDTSSLAAALAVGEG